MKLNELNFNLIDLRPPISNSVHKSLISWRLALQHFINFSLSIFRVTRIDRSIKLRLPISIYFSLFSSTSRNRSNYYDLIRQIISWCICRSQTFAHLTLLVRWKTNICRQSHVLSPLDLLPIQYRGLLFVQRFNDVIENTLFSHSHRSRLLRRVSTTSHRVCLQIWGRYEVSVDMCLIS